MVSVQYGGSVFVASTECFQRWNNYAVGVLGGSGFVEPGGKHCISHFNSEFYILIEAGDVQKDQCELTWLRGWLQLRLSDGFRGVAALIDEEIH